MAKELFTGDAALLKQKLWELDLEPIMVKLMDKKEGEGWSLDQTLLLVEEYRRFLFLTVTRSEVIVPTLLTDKVWHAHILDTIKYREDCNELFGFFIDHFPYFGMRGDEDAKNLETAFATTMRLHVEVFGAVLDHKAAVCGCGSGGCNGGACSTCAEASPDLAGSASSRYNDGIRPRLSETYRM